MCVTCQPLSLRDLKLISDGEGRRSLSPISFSGDVISCVSPIRRCFGISVGYTPRPRKKSNPSLPSKPDRSSPYNDISPRLLLRNYSSPSQILNHTSPLSFPKERNNNIPFKSASHSHSPCLSSNTNLPKRAGRLPSRRYPCRFALQ